MNLKELHSFKMSDAVKFHDQLNPKLFHGQHLDSVVRKKLLVIAEDFLNELGISDFKVKDITMSGSNAAYSYTPHSDIDLHLIVDMDQFAKDKVYQELFNAKKTVYNDTHDIKIKDISVELYVQPASDPHVSLGEYSILDDHWIKFPLKRRANFDQNNTKAKYEQLKSFCVRALKERDLKKVSKVIKKIKQYRKAGLANFGEFGPENLAYKMIKNQGYLQKLFDLRNKLHSAKLSFETMHQNLKTIKETIGPHQGKELELMLRSSKPAAIINSDNLKNPLWKKAIKENDWTVQQITKIPNNYRTSDPITIVSKDPETANHIKKLMLTTLGGPSPAPAAYHIQLGRLLGYSEEDINHFLNKQGYKKSDQISEETVPEKKVRTLYHVTLTSNLPQIHEKGITQYNPSNWIKAGTKERYGEGEIYAFDNINDARAWAGKMDWTKNKKIGSGNISIVKFTDDGAWEEDPAPLVAVRGHALKKNGKVASKNILDAEPLTQAMIVNLSTNKQVTEEITTLQKMYGNNLPDRSEIFWNYISGNDLKKPLEIQIMPKHSVMHHLLGQYRVEHIDDLMDMLNDDQVEKVAQYMADPKLSDNIIVVDNNKIIDGNHRALAAAVKGVPIKYVDLSEPLDEATIDNREGWGAVPYNQDVDYFGLRVKMTPNTFLKLAAPLDDEPSEKIHNHIQKGGAIGAPHLYITIPEDWDNKDFSMPAHVAQHEGRNRMKSILKIEGDHPIEVHLFPLGGYRNRDLTPEFIKTLNKGLYAEKSRRLVPGPLFSMVDNKQGVAESENNSIPPIGINVRSDGDIDYADLIVDGKKKYESRNTDSLSPYVGKTVGIIRTGSGPAVAIGQATIGEPIVADEEKFNKLRKKHLVPKGSKFDIDSNGTKYLYPIIDPVRWDDEKVIKKKGIVARKIDEQDSRRYENYNGINMFLQETDDDEVYVIASVDGKELGHVLFVMDRDYLLPQDLEVEEKYRGQGIATVMYDFVKSKGYKIRRSGQQTDDGAKFWAKHRPKQNFWEQEIAEALGYKEIEFVCVNSEFLGGTSLDAQKALYKDLKQLKGVIPLYQDFSEYGSKKLSLTAIYKDPKLKKEILSLAKQHGVEIDIIKSVSDDYANRALNKEHDYQIIEASGYIPSKAQKNDPRYKTALTVDVKPDSIQKNAKAFGFKTSRAGIPPTVRPNGKV